MRKTIVVKRSGRGVPAYTVFCPECNSPGTEWHPDTQTGACHTCGAKWRVADDAPKGGSLWDRIARRR